MERSEALEEPQDQAGPRGGAGRERLGGNLQEGLEGADQGPAGGNLQEVGGAGRGRLGGNLREGPSGPEIGPGTERGQGGTSPGGGVPVTGEEETIQR